MASQWYLLLVIIVAYVIIQLGLALPEANIIPFGTDQMPEASSRQKYCTTNSSSHMQHKIQKLLDTCWRRIALAEVVLYLESQCIIRK